MEKNDFIDMDGSHNGSPDIPSKSKHKYKSKQTEPHPTPTILKWLRSNYELADGVCIPRSTLYVHYTDFCEYTGTKPMNAASFGKMIRQQFPQLTTRRLGTRGQSKYHYYGIAVRETSKYFEENYSSKGVESTSNEITKKEHPRQTVAYSPRSKLGTLLPAFPAIKDIKLPSNTSEGKVSTFLMMYRTHCQRILDTVIRANFDEVESYLLHFWQGMPPHMLGVLDSTTVADIVGLCDSILYKAIAGVLMPSVTQTIPDSLTQVIRAFAQRLEDWLHTALDQLPESLCNTKFTMARHFSQLLQRQTSLNHLCQASKSTIQSGDVTSQMADDWSILDLRTIASQTLYAVQDMGAAPPLTKLCVEFGSLLDEQPSLETYTSWLDALLMRCVEKVPPGQGSGSVCQRSRRFMFIWSCFSTKVMRDMTLHSSPSFGSFHLLHMTLDEYVHYRLELIRTQDRADCFLRILKGEREEAFDTDEILPLSQTSRYASRMSFQQSSQHQYRDSSSSPDSTIIPTPNCDHPMRTGHSEMSPSYMACLESREPVNIPASLSCAQTSCAHPAPPDEFGGYSCPTIYSSENSAFSPVGTSSDYSNYEAPHQSHSNAQHTSRPQPFCARSAFSSRGFQGNSLYSHMNQEVDTVTPDYLDHDDMLASREKYGNRSQPVGASYGQFGLVPHTFKDTTCAEERHPTMQRLPYQLHNREYPHFGNYNPHHEPILPMSSHASGMSTEIC